MFFAVSSKGVDDEDSIGDIELQGLIKEFSSSSLSNKILKLGGQVYDK